MNKETQKVLVKPLLISALSGFVFLLIVNFFPEKGASTTTPENSNSLHSTISTGSSTEETLKASEDGQIMGALTIGPLCTGETTGPECLPTKAMFDARVLSFYKKDTLVATTVANSLGFYEMNLKEGDYELRMQKAMIGSIDGAPFRFTVRKGEKLSHNIAVNTGIK